MTSDSAKTVHMLLSVIVSSASQAARPKSSSVKPRSRAMTSRKRPVPAAQRSFISKSANAPAPFPRTMTLESWPPMSMTSPASGLRKRAPSAQAVISVTTRQSRWAFMRYRP